MLTCKCKQEVVITIIKVDMIKQALTTKNENQLHKAKYQRCLSNFFVSKCEKNGSCPDIPSYNMEQEASNKLRKLGLNAEVKPLRSEFQFDLFSSNSHKRIVRIMVLKLKLILIINNKVKLILYDSTGEYLLMVRTLTIQQIKN